MAEDHSKYMPHHPKPKFAKGKGSPKLQDPMLRARGGEPTSHDGSAEPTSGFGDYNQGYYQAGPSGSPGQSAPDAGMM